MEALVHALLLEKEYVEFLVGRDGDFDQIVSSAVKRQQRLVRDDNSSLAWILPYPTAELITMRYAQKEKKNILNLAEEGYGEKE